MGEVISADLIKQKKAKHQAAHNKCVSGSLADGDHTAYSLSKISGVMGSRFRDGKVCGDLRTPFKTYSNCGNAP